MVYKCAVTLEEEPHYQPTLTRKLRLEDKKLKWAKNNNAQSK